MFGPVGAFADSGSQVLHGFTTRALEMAVLKGVFDQTERRW